MPRRVTPPHRAKKTGKPARKIRPTKKANARARQPVHRAKAFPKKKQRAVGGPNQADYQTLLLAALLHDVSALFGIEKPASVAQAESNAALRAILDRARDWATPGGTHPEKLADAPLISVFSMLSHENISAPATRVFDYAPLASTDASAEYLFPRDTTKASRQIHLQAFQKAYDERLTATASADFDVRFNHLFALFQQFGWCLAAHSNDVCLFDHLRLTVALAACLARAKTAKEEKSQPFVLVVGDLSGIQDYIFDIATVGAAGASRRLRARSFSIGLISDVVSHALTHAFDLPLANVLMASGGKFYVLVPNLAATEKKLQDFRRELDAWLFKEYNGEIGLNLAWLELGQNEFDASRADKPGFGALVSKLNRKLGITKQQRSRSVLQSKSSWLENKFAIDLDFKGERDCVSCGKFPGTERDGLCRQCAQQSRLGSKLTRARALAFTRGVDPSADLILFNYSVHVLTAEEFLNFKASPYLVVQLNDPDLNKLTNYPATFRYLANHVPLGEHDAPLDFGKIAKKGLTSVSETQSKGRELLGYVKGDADRLGSLFAEGLRDESDAQSHDTAAHVMAFSRELDLFFSGWLEHELKRNRGDFYTIFSGGDDLFVLGPWNQALDFATHVNIQFHRFTCDNQAVTFSTGILYTKPRYPIARAAPDAEEELEKSKDAGRNRLTVLGDTVEWNHLATVTGEIGKLELINDDALRSAFLYRLIDYAEMYRRAKHKEKAEAARYKSHFAYTVARNLRDDRSGLREWADTLLQGLFVNEDRSDTSEAEKVKAMESRERMNHLGLVATLALFTRRVSGRNENA